MFELAHEILFNNPMLSVGLAIIFMLIALIFGNYIYNGYNAFFGMIFSAVFWVLAVFTFLPYLDQKGEIKPEYSLNKEETNAINDAKKLLESNGYSIETNDLDESKRLLESKGYTVSRNIE